MATVEARHQARSRATEEAENNPAALDTEEEDMMVYIPCWAGFATGPHDEPATGALYISLQTRSVSVDPPPIGAEQASAYTAVFSQAEQMQVVVLDAIVGAMLQIRERAYPDLVFPALVDRAALEDMVTLVGVHIHDVEHEGVAYVGYELNCVWDQEHGVGVMTHGTRVVEVGGADTSLLGWLAERDRDGT